MVAAVSYLRELAKGWNVKGVGSCLFLASGGIVLVEMPWWALLGQLSALPKDT